MANEYPKPPRDPEKCELEQISEENANQRDPETGWIPWGNMPKSLKFYEFGEESLPFIRDDEQIKLLLEHLMGSLLVLERRRLTRSAAEGISKRFGNHVNYIEGGMKPLWYHELKKDVIFLELSFSHKSIVERESKKIGKTKLWFGNAPFETDVEGIRNTFEAIGFGDTQIISVEFTSGKEDWKHRGTGYIFVEPDIADKIVEVSKKNELMVANGRGARALKISHPNTSWTPKPESHNKKPGREY